MGFNFPTNSENLSRNSHIIVALLISWQYNYILGNGQVKYPNIATIKYVL